MKNNMEKMKKKRKINDAIEEVPIKKKKSKKQEQKEQSEGTSPDTDSQVAEVVSQSENRVDGKKKEKKKKRAVSDGLENSEELKKSKVNEDVSATNEVTENGAMDVDVEAEAEDSDKDDTQKTKISSKEANKLSGKSLRKSFNSAEGIDALRKFVLVCTENKEKDLAAEYLQAGGGVLEVLRLLDTSDKKNINNASTVFTAMHIIIMKILSEYPQYQSRAEEACRHFINSHLSFVHSMMSSQSNVKHRRTVLRLLASMVSLGGSLPRELLAHLSFHSQVLDTLCQQTRPTDPQSVRICFIHFVLSFLVEGNVPVIRAMLEKRGMLSCIFPELIYDSHTVVHLVLDTVKTYVVENTAISKTTKLKVFSTPVLQSLVSLYNWKGPKNWRGPKGKKQESDKCMVHPEEKEIAVEAVHDFLSTLLTSNRQGVIFHDRNLGTAGIKNSLVLTILQSLDRPWEHSKPMDLVVKILVACPDLIRSQLSYTEPFLEPRASGKWILVMQFVGKIIESLDAESCLKPCLPELSTSQLITAVTGLTVPTLVLKNAIAPSLSNPHLLIRQQGILLLTIMLRQAKAFINLVANDCHNVADFLAFKRAMTDYILKNVPNLESILKLWSLVLTEEQEEPPTTQEDISDLIPKRHSHFAAILDLLQVYRDVCPERMDLGGSTGSDLDPSILLTGLSQLPDVETEELGKMKIKALQFLLDVDPASFAPSKPLFGETLSFLISLLEENPTEINTLSRKTIKMLLTTSEMFEGCADEMDIWIHSFARLQNAEEKREVANWFVKIVHQAIKRTDKYLALIAEAEEVAGEQVVSAARLEDIFNDLVERDPENTEPRAAKMLPSTCISPVLCSALENLKKNPNEITSSHLSYIIILTLHCQVAPGSLIHLAKNIEDFPAKKYLKSWSYSEKPIAVPKSISSGRIVDKLSKALLKDEKELNKVFEGDKSVEFEFQGKKIQLNHSLSEFEVANALKLTLFYLSQFIQREESTEELFDKYNFFINALLHLAKNLSVEESSNFGEECSRMICMHPTIFHNFLPFFKSKNKIEKIVTKGFLNICQTIVELNEESSLPDLFLAFKNKLMTQLRSAVKKCASGGEIKNSLAVNEFVEILRVTAKDAVEILKVVVELPDDQFLGDDKVSLSIWGIIAAKFVELLARKNYGEQDATIDADLAKKIVTRFAKLKIRRNVQMDVWDASVNEFLESYPHHIAAIDNSCFITLLQRARSSPAINLLSFLVSRNRGFVQPFVKHVSSNSKLLSRSEFIFPIVTSNPSYTWNTEFLKKLETQYKQHVVRYFTEPMKENNWVSKNVEATRFLIANCFERESCTQASEAISSNVDKLDNVDTYYIQLLETLFKRLAKLHDESEDSLTKLLQFLIRIMASALKKDAKNKEKLENLCDSLCDTVELLRSKDSGCVFQDITKNYSWPQFTRFSLKLGLKPSTDGQKQLPLLKMLASVCEIAYRDAGDDEYVKTLFEMTTSHSEFVNFILSSQKKKKDLLELLFVLVRKNHSMMASSHIPLYLAAYGATLSESDQVILLLLRFYEAHGIKFDEYRPYLWGEAAATHYSVKGEADTALWRQPSTSQVLDLLDLETVKDTIRNFPVERDLKPEGLIEPSRVYDPSFYLPLFSYLLSDYNVITCHKVIQGGALALIFAACGSACEDTRLAGYTAISRFYFHLEAASSKSKILCIRIIDALRNGVLNLETPLPKTRLSCLVSTFLARTSLVTTEPMNVLYAPLQSFLMAKPAMELRTIPELLNLLHSSEVEHKQHRHWILEVIRDGMKTDFDMGVAMKCFLFKMLLDFYTSVLSDRVTKRLILEILEATVKIPKAGLLLARSYGLFAWLNEAAIDLEARDVEKVNLLVSIVSESVDVVLKSREREHQLEFLLLLVLGSLKSKLSKSTGVRCYGIYTETLSKLVRTKSSAEALRREDLEELVELGKTVLGEVGDAKELLLHGSSFAARPETPKEDFDEVSVARTSLRKVVLAWCDCKR